MSERLVITENERITVATIMMRKGVTSAAVGKALGCAAPTSAGRMTGRDLSLIGTGPGTWLAIADAPGGGWARQLAHKLEGLASVSDQSDAYAVFRIAGPDARAFLQRGVFIDLDPSVFEPGSTAVTAIGYIGVILWQANATPAFEVAVFRSFATSFRHWMDVTAAAL